MDEVRWSWLTWRGGPGDGGAVVAEGGCAGEDGGAFVVARLHCHLVRLALLQALDEQLRGRRVVLVCLAMTLDAPEHAEEGANVSASASHCIALSSPAG